MNEILYQYIYLDGYNNFHNLEMIFWVSIWYQMI